VSKELRDKLIYMAAGIVLGLATSYYALGRDVARLTAEVSYLRQDVGRINLFIGSDDPARFRAAKAEIKAEVEAAEAAK
jgi:hypothetical protein